MQKFRKFVVSPKNPLNLKELRNVRNLTQADVGDLVKLSQKRICQLEANLGRTRFEQVLEIIFALKGRMTIELPDSNENE
ncbi:MAG: helix-turn-helix domain-containing protein [Verrucomicrobiales bacterium]|jgi:HTH-type transcriptional regulator/antitoxin HipB|nr:helix-turn-helix domain-containing protein [Verrucomicrobiales bacterium]